MSIPDSGADTGVDTGVDLDATVTDISTTGAG